MSIDLNALRDTLVRNQESGNAHPDQKENKIFVDNEGNIKSGSEVTQEDTETLSEVPQETFANSRFQRDLLFSRKFMPTNTQVFTTPESAKGFVYSITCEFGSRYKFFVYFDGAFYQAYLVYPPIEQLYGAHEGHLFSDGRICLAPGNGGVISLKDAYTKTVVWASGISVTRNGGEFPFAHDQ